MTLTRKIKNEQETSLKSKVVKGSFWIMSLRVLSRLLSFIKVIIIAHFLSPKDFGLFGIATVSLLFLETFTQPGFKEALIQKNKDISGYLNSAWSLGIIRSIILFILLFLTAPIITDFYAVPDATFLIRLIALTFLIDGFSNIAVLHFEKNLHFNKLFKYEASAVIMDFSTTIISAVILKNVWALIIGLIIGKSIRLLMSYILCDYRPRISLDFSAMKDMFGYGRWIMLINILTFAYTQADLLVIGKVLGAAFLGLYQMAAKISNLAVTEITQVISRIMFPAYSKLQNNIDHLRVSFLKVLEITLFLIIPLTGISYILIDEFTELFLGNAWQEIIVPAKILILAALFRATSASTGPLFKATSNAKYDFTTSSVRVIILLSLLIPLTINYGMLGSAISVLTASIIGFITSTYFLFKIINPTPKKIIKLITMPVISLIPGILIVLLLKNILATNYVTFSLFVLISTISYMSIIYYCDKNTSYKVFSKIYSLKREII